MGKTSSKAFKGEKGKLDYFSMLNESGKKISDADRRLLGKVLLDESGKTISDADRARLMEKYITRNDGGMAQKTRVF